MQPRRNKQAAKKFFRKLLKGLQYIPRVMVTDKLRSYPAAMAEVMPSVQHQQQGRLNNRAENSHQPTRERERRMRGFKSPGHAQRFLSSFGTIASFFVLVGTFWRLKITGKSCAVGLHNGANLRASNLPVDRQFRSPTSSLPSRPLFASILTAS